MNNYLGGDIFGEHSLIERDLEEIPGLTLRRTSEAEQPLQRQQQLRGLYSLLT